ncbi:MAG: hypothetical protein LC798_20425 [Chloroflexi bacterium]|nr:hypothetical protein [Chloroflexota bacterium]
MTYQETGAGGQTTVGTEANDQEHLHPEQVHSHDHYHVTHHHTGGPLGAFDHRAHYHSHEHNHAPLLHGHDYDPENEDEDHGQEAHVHDHNEPTGEGV